jgi:hypothetical protein
MTGRRLGQRVSRGPATTRLTMRASAVAHEVKVFAAQALLQERGPAQPCAVTQAQPCAVTQAQPCAVTQAQPPVPSRKRSPVPSRKRSPVPDGG